MSVTVVVLTKLSSRLPVKTRLIPLLGEDGARAFYDECLAATVARAREFTDDVVVAYSPADAPAPAAHFKPVAGGDGAACLERALHQEYRGRPLIALGGDAPDLPLDHLRSLNERLRTVDVAFVPTGDGGFSALATRTPLAGLADGFLYGGDDALSSLRSFLEARGFAVGFVAPWPDIDTPAHYAAYRARCGDG